MKNSFRKMILFAAGLSLGATAVTVLAFSPKDDNELSSTTPDGRLQYRWYAPTLPKTFTFAGEAVPLTRWEVRERFDRELLSNYYMHGGLLYILKLTTRYFPVIEQRLAAAGIPDDFKYLCIAESSLQHLTSSAGAQSFWQFLGATGKQYGLQIDEEVDERYDVAKATDAACKYFREAYTKFGSWTAAAASYNCGMGGYNNQVTYQGSSNYYDLLLPEETNRYIFRILALKYLVSNPARSGYMLQKEDAYQPFKTRSIAVDSSISNLSQFAQANGSSYKMLKLLNPWLRSRSLTVRGGKTYVVLLPE